MLFLSNPDFGIFRVSLKPRSFPPKPDPKIDLVVTNTN